jgi:chorismate mutase/prephenate dehydratase
MSKEKDLNSIRDNIDSLDERILSLLNERANLAIEAGQAKEESIKYKPAREATIFNKLKEINKGPLSNNQIISIYNEIISACRSTESDLRVAYLGPEGTYSQSALQNKFGSSVQTKPEPTIRSVFEEVKEGLCDFGIVPIENSTEGSVNLTLDCLMDFDLTICGEIEMRIEHNLIGYNKPMPKEGIEIHAHEQSLAQCKDWLSSYCPQAKLVPVSSNSQAAMNATSNDGVLAIGGKEAAEKYNLDILDSNIEDSSSNTTRFIVIGKSNSSQTSNDKTSIVVTTKNEEGALYSVLLPFNELSLNLSHLTYRPSKKDKWHYSFFLDFEGHKDQEDVQQLFKQLDILNAEVKILGSFPKAIT